MADRSKVLRYVSTRGKAPVLEFGDVLLTGLASDGGLYVPESWPVLSPQALSWNPVIDSYAELAVEVMWPFVEGAYTWNRFEELVQQTYSCGDGGFDHLEIAPMVELGGGVWLMELFHGPTLAFKDIALQLVGRLFAEELEHRNTAVTIVGATSGDTGSAAIEAVKGRPNIQIVMLHPNRRVSETQRRQMTTVASPNVYNVAIEGTFDDCQDLVKAMFADTEFRQKQRLSAVNSINWARVMAQMVYYVVAARWLAIEGATQDGGRAVSFCVPTGNFGNVLAAYAIRQMGQAVERLVVASNRNDILTQFFTTGSMTIGEVKPTLSPSMDIQVSSNLERLLFELLGRDGSRTVKLLEGFRDSGTMSLSQPIYEELQHFWVGIKVDDAATSQTIAECYQNTGRIIDPHTAVGLSAAQRNQQAQDGPMVVMSTAHPAKFAETVEHAIGKPPPVPSVLQDMANLPEHYVTLPNDLAIVKDFVASC